MFATRSYRFLPWRPQPAFLHAGGSLSYVLEGALEHKVSLGTGSVIQPGDVQRMSAGTGVQHSEWNHSTSETVHFLQMLDRAGGKALRPSYEQQALDAAELRGRRRLVASRDGRDGSVTVHQDADLYAASLAPGDEVSHPLALGRYGWVHVARRRGAATPTREAALPARASTTARR